ncbi:glycosyltransferase family 2 protein [Nitrospira moscoviensis]|uniref:glycosyltransferase family 2 protein n=1 Tax=Nitrospira moscoviensis TaxID=42253 RepID=UPI00165134A6|nr:glycosyltransferase family 2 protein [Nitrospira moscoviensis]
MCIPTYGQTRQLKRTLDSLLGQDLQDVEIVIRDDNSDAETEKMVAAYRGKLPIRYFRLRKEGVDRAFMFLSREAEGNFVWWFGDDVFCPGAIGNVMKVLMTHPTIDFMYINSTDLSGAEYSVQICGSRMVKDRNEMLAQLKDQLGFCSAMLFKREILLTGMDRAEQFIGTSWVTLFLSLNALVVGRTFYLLDGKNFLSDPKPPGETRWYDSFEVHGINYSIVARQFEEFFDRKILKRVLAYKFGRSWRAVVVERAQGFTTGFACASPKMVKMAKLYWNYPEFYLASILMLMPRPILRLCYALYKRT